MANVIKLPNGITIESTDPTAQNLTISREAYTVLENFSAESIYEAANFIMSQEDYDYSHNSIDKDKLDELDKEIENGGVDEDEHFQKRSYQKRSFKKEKEAKRSIKDYVIKQMGGSAFNHAVHQGITGAAITKGGVHNRLQGGRLGALVGAGVGAAQGLGNGIVGGAANELYYRKTGKNLSNMSAGFIGGTLVGAANGAIHTRGTFRRKLGGAAIGGIRRGLTGAAGGSVIDVIEAKRQAQQEKIDAKNSKESFMLPSGQKVYVV